MARKAKAVKTEYNIELAKELVALAAKDEAMYVAEHEVSGLLALTHNGQPCFEADYDDRDGSDVFMSATEAGVAMFNPAPVARPVPPMAAPVAPAEVKVVGSDMGYDIVEGYEIPARDTSHLIKREAQYPWANILPGQAFFVPARLNETTGKLMSIASAVAAQNRKYAETTKEKSFKSRPGSRVVPETGEVLQGEWVKCEEYHEPRKRAKKSVA